LKRLIGIITAAAVLASAAPIFAAGRAQHGKPAASKAAAVKPAAKNSEPKAAPKRPAVKQAQVRCPVMGGVVKDPKKAPKSVYKGKTYYFCCPGCKPEFDKEPEKYIKKAAPKS